MTNFNLIPLLTALILFVVIITIFKGDCENTKEGWVNYKNLPFGNIDSGKSSPLVMYDIPRYRKPYNWPQCFITNHPERHCRHFE